MLPRSATGSSRVPFWDGLGAPNLAMFTRHKEV